MACKSAPTLRINLLTNAFGIDVEASAKGTGGGSRNVKSMKRTLTRRLCHVNLRGRGKSRGEVITCDAGFEVNPGI